MSKDRKLLYNELAQEDDRIIVWHRGYGCYCSHAMPLCHIGESAGSIKSKLGQVVRPPPITSYEDICMQDL